MGKLDYVRIPWEKMHMKPAMKEMAQPDIGIPSKMPLGTVIGAMPGVGYVANQRRGLHK